MVQNTTEGRTRHTESNLSLADVSVGDRIEPLLIPSSPDLSVGEYAADHSPRYNTEDERTFGVRLIASNSRYDDIQHALVYDPDADLFARLSGHSSSSAMSQAERDYKVRDVGRDASVVDEWDVDIPDLNSFGETEREFVAEWANLLFGNIRHGEQAGDEIQSFSGKTFTLRDYDGREACIEYELVTEEANE